MPVYRLKVWREQVLGDEDDYQVDAPTLSAAVDLLEAAADRACDEGKDVTEPAITDDYGSHSVAPLDPENIMDVKMGIALTDAMGNRIRDLVGVPEGEEQRGSPLGKDE